MVAKNLEGNPFFQLLESRAEKEADARVYAGLLLLTEPEAQEALEFIKGVFPGFTPHGMAHSLRILTNLYQALSDPLREALSAPELFCLMMAAMFHDMGMALPEEPDRNRQRQEHHLYAEGPLERFMEEKLTGVKEWRRLYSCILFVCQAHGMTLEEFYGRGECRAPDMIEGRPLRYGLLGALLRIGDLLDLDENRTSGFIRRLYAPYFQDRTSQRHHERHERIRRFFISPQTIDISVEAADVEEYHIWESWLRYLREDILYANTYLLLKLERGVTLPELHYEINKAPGADFETEELRFELTEEGRIWSILSQSIYTEEFDFIRELVQNGIDAVLLRCYQSPETALDSPSPRSWGAWDREARVTVAYSAARQVLLVWDDGVGMNLEEVRRFLFKIADSGYRYQPEARPFPFPAIAKFGIGFISCLSKCGEIVLYTQSVSGEEGCRVRMYADSVRAYFERLAARSAGGTTVCMLLRRSYPAPEILAYLARTFRYPSVPVEWLDLDGMEEQLEGLADLKRLRTRPAFAQLYQMPGAAFEACYETFDVVRESVHRERLAELETARDLGDQIRRALRDWEAQERAGTLEQRPFAREMGLLLRSVQPLDRHTDIRRRMGELLEEAAAYPAKDFLGEARGLLSQVRDCAEELDVVQQRLRELAGAYRPPRRRLGREALSPFWEFQACLVPFTGDFSGQTAVTDSREAGRYLRGTGLFFVQCAFDDWELGVEWRSVHGFLFQNGGLTLQLVCMREGERSSLEDRYGIDLKEALDEGLILDHNPLELLEDYLEQTGNLLEEDIEATVLHLDAERNRVVRQASVWQRRQDFSGYWHTVKEDGEDGWNSGTLDEYLLWIVRDLYGEEVPEAAALEEMYRRENGVYQDGMPLDMDLTDLVPLGMCRLQVNLSGEARMELNVTRRHADGTQARTDAWLAAVGARIQRQVLDQLARTIREWGLHGSLRELCTPGALGEYFAARSLEQLSRMGRL